MRRATRECVSERLKPQNFYPRSPCGERPAATSRPGRFTTYFYPRSPCGERPWNPGPTVRCARFLSTLSLRRATGPDQQHKRHLQDFYSRSPRGERQAMCTIWECTSKFLSTLSLRRATGPKPCLGTWALISIHALLAESDPSSLRLRPPASNFYPRSPCGERLSFIIYSITDNCISIHALLAESDYGALKHVHQTEISIHALLAESDRGGVLMLS